MERSAIIVLYGLEPTFPTREPPFAHHIHNVQQFAEWLLNCFVAWMFTISQSHPHRGYTFSASFNLKLFYPILSDHSNIKVSNYLVVVLNIRAGEIFRGFWSQTTPLSLTKNMTPYQFLGPYNIVIPRHKSFEAGHFISTLA